MEDDADGEKQNRVLLRPWLENMLENRNIPGLEWFDDDKTMFKVPWKHRSKKDWSMRHSSVFLEWAKNTGRWSEGDPAPNFAQLKTRLRCAFNKAPDIDEMKEHHYSKGEEPYKVYRFNTRRGEAKSVFGRKTCQKTAGKQGHRSRSPPMMKYESCEEEVIEDDYALYEDMDVHSTVPASKANMSGAGQPMEESFQRNLIYTHSDNLMHGNALFTTAGWTFGRDGGTADSQNDLRDSKSPIIPLTVEMMMSANGDSDCDADSPKKSWNRPVENSSGPVVNSVRAIKCEGSSGKIHVAETHGNSTPNADGSTDRMHLLQMASLFVEAAERQKQEDIVVDETPTEQASSVESAENFTPAKHYVIIMPSSYGKEVENVEQINEENVTSGYVTPTGTEAIDLTVQMEDSNLSSISKDNVKHLTELKVSSRIDSADSSHIGPCLQLKDLTEISPPKQPVCEPEEAVDLTKPAVLTKCSEMMAHQTNSADLADEVQVPMSASSSESKGNRDSKARRNYALLTDSYTEDEAYTSVEELKTSEYATFEQMSHLSIEQLAIKARRLCEWEKRLKSWEMQLQAKEETLYWRDRCLQSEMGTKAAAYHISNEGVVWNKEPLPVHIASQSGAVSSLPFTRFRPTIPCTLATPNQPAANLSVATPNLPGAIPNRLVATHNLPVVTSNRPGPTPNRPVASPNLPVASPKLETGTPVTSGSELKQRLAQIIKSNRLPALRAEGGSPAARQYVDMTQTPLQPSTTVPSSVTGGAVVSSRPFVGHPVAAETYSVSAGSQQPIPLVSLIRPSKGMQMIVPVLGGSQPMLFVPRHLVPVAMAMQAQAVQSETHDILKSNLETTNDGKATTKSHELDSRKSEQNSSLSMETNAETDVKNTAVLAPSQLAPSQLAPSPLAPSQLAPPQLAPSQLTPPQSKRDDISPEAEITTSVSNQEPRESSQSKHSATPNSRCSSLTGLGSDSDAEDRNDQQEVPELHPGTDSVNGVKCGDDEITNEPTTTFKNNTRSRNVSGKSTASDPCEKTSAENLSILPSVSGNEDVGKTGKDNEGVVSCRKDVKLPESVQKQLAGHGSLLDFTKWLREKTETICKEESQEGRKAVECCGQVQLCSDSPSSKEKFEHLNVINIPSFASIKIANNGSSVNGGVPCSDSLVSTQGSQSVSPVSSPNVPLVVEHENDFLEKECDDEEASSANESPLNSRKQTNLGSRRKRSCEKPNVLKKARVDC